MGHFQRICPKLAQEAPGQSHGKVSSLVVQDAGKHLEQCSIEEMEKAVSQRKAGAEQLN